MTFWLFKATIWNFSFNWSGDFAGYRSIAESPNENENKYNYELILKSLYIPDLDPNYVLTIKRYILKTGKNVKITSIKLDKKKDGKANN